MSNGTKTLTLKYFIVKKIFVGYPKRQNYFATNNFHMKISNSEFFPNYSNLKATEGNPHLLLLSRIGVLEY